MSLPASGNDDWDDLARELGVSKSDPHPAPPPDMVERIVDAEAVEPHHGDPRAEGDALAAGEPELAADETPDAESADNPNVSGEPIPAAEGEPGKRKRRRRRRRRKGAPAEGTELVATGPDDDAAEPDEDDLAEAADSTETSDEGTYAEVAADGTDAADYDTDDALQPVGLQEEDVANEALRELIATWNVPAWDEIVSGLYRPN